MTRAHDGQVNGVVHVVQGWAAGACDGQMNTWCTGERQEHLVHRCVAGACGAQVSDRSTWCTGECQEHLVHR